jgi:hypothetical protein
VRTQLCGPTAGYFRRFGACESADAAAAFSDFVLRGFASTLPAADAALRPVCRVFRFTDDTPCVRLSTTTRRARLLGLTTQQARPSEGGL